MKMDSEKWLIVFIVVLAGYGLYKNMTMPIVKPKTNLTVQTGTQNPSRANPSLPINPMRNRPSQPNQPTPSNVSYQRAVELDPNLQLIERFKKTVYLDVNLPTEYKYQELDLDVEGVAAIYGRNAQKDTRITLLARRGPVSNEDLKQFLVENAADIPGFDSRATSAFSNQPEIGEARDGLKPPQIWNTKINDKTISIALIQRTDGQGSYLAIFSGASTYLDQHEERFESIYDSMKVQNP